MIMRIRIISTMLATLALLGKCDAQEQDIMVQQSSGRLVTGFADLDNSNFTSPTFVYTRGLFASSSVPGNWLGTNPGFFSLAQGSLLLPPNASALPAATDIFWDFLPMTDEQTVSNLFYWDGIDDDMNGFSSVDVSVSVPTTNLELRLSSPGTGTGFGSAAVMGTTELVEGKKVERTAFDGSIHHHGIFRLNATMGDIPPAEGVYIVSMHLRTAGTIGTSDPFFIAFRTGGIASAAETAAADWILENYDTLIAPPTLAGDFNGDGRVDAADYTVWRDNLGAMDLPLVDADGSGEVDAGDYSIWRSNFGAIATMGSSSSFAQATTVPEATSFWLVSSAVALFFWSRRTQ